MGEESTREVVEQRSDRRAVLARLPLGWRVLHQTPWAGRPGAVVDHIAIGASGVFVLVVEDGQDGPEGPRDGTDALAAAEAVARLLPGLPRDRVHGVLVGAAHPAPWPEVDGVIRCESVDLLRLLRSRPSVLTAEEVAGVVGVVHVGLERAERAERAGGLVVGPERAVEPRSRPQAWKRWFRRG